MVEAQVGDNASFCGVDEKTLCVYMGIIILVPVCLCFGVRGSLVLSVQNKKASGRVACQTYVCVCVDKM